MGMEKWEIQRKTGFTVRRLTLLESDPTFQQLIAHYANLAEADRQAVIDEYQDIQELNALVAARLISEKLDDALETGAMPSYAQLLAITTSRDRRAAAKAGMPNVTVNIGLALDAAKERAGKARDVTLESNHLSLLPPPRPRHTDTGLRPEHSLKRVSGPAKEGDLKKMRI